MISICTKTQENFHLILPETVFLQSIAVYPFPSLFRSPAEHRCVPPFFLPMSRARRALLCTSSLTPHHHRPEPRRALPCEQFPPPVP